MKEYANIDVYIEDFSEPVKGKLIELRKLIGSLVPPSAEETINYGIPTYKFYGNLVHFGGFKKHVSLFPGASGVAAFMDELKGYEVTKGTIQFPLDKPLPVDLITRIVKFRIEESLTKATKKKSVK